MRDHIEEILQNIGAEAVPDDVRNMARETSNDFSRSLEQSKQPKRLVLLEHIIRSRMSKLIAAAVIIIAALPLVLFFDRGVAPVYALEQTIEANHTIKTIHLRIVEGDQSIENNEFTDCWIKYDDAGLVSNFRCNIYEEGEERAYAVWNEGVLKIWRPSQNVVIVIRVNDMEKYWEHFAQEYDPKLIFQWLYVSRGNQAHQLHIDKPAEDSNSIYVSATHSVDKTRLKLVIDPQTKLVKELSRYRLGEQKDELETRIEVLAYNESIDPSMFTLSDIPEDALLIDQVDQLVGLEQGNLTNNEIAIKVVRETLEAAITKDYEKVSRLMEGAPGETIEEFFEEEFDARLVRVISIGQPELQERSAFHIYVPCEIEVENKERGTWTVRIGATSEFINYQAGRRWVMHRPDQSNGSHISTDSKIHAQDRLGEQLIVPGEGMGDFRLGISKDEVLRRLGKPRTIFLGSEKYTLNNLPRRFFMLYNDLAFDIKDDIVTGITAHSPLYKFANGLGVGDSEQKIKQAFGEDFHLEEGRGKDFLIYEDQGLSFEIHKQDRTVMEINVSQAKHNQQSDRGSGKDVLNLIRQAAAEGRIAYKRTTPEEFKQIAGKPTQERVSEGGDVVEMEYPGIWVKFFGKPDLDTPVTILWIAYDGGNIDIGKDRYQKNVKVPSVQPFDKEKGKNPGLGVRRLHEKGITGRGVRVAILDQKLLVDHQEYAERVRLYEEIDLRARMNPQMHGAAVASIAVGKTVGVAPEAELYYIAKKGGPRYVAQGIDRILKINEQLPKDNKIRVISISVGWNPSNDSYEDNMAACERAKAAGIFVVSCSLDHVYGFQFHGLGRDPSADPDVFESYEPGLWWAKEFYEGTELLSSNRLLVPMDSRTTASPNGKDKYIFHREGGWSWSVPYIAGVYALAAQVEPDITPERFWNLALKTGRTIQLEHEGEKRPFGLIIDPVRLIRSIEAGQLSDVSRNQSSNTVSDGVFQRDSKTQTIVPGARVGDYLLGMSKDDVFSKLGKPDVIHLRENEVVRRGEENYNLDELPNQCALSFGDVTFLIEGNSVGGIFVHSPLYKLSNGLKVGDSEQKIKQAFGEDFRLEEAFGKDYLCYDIKGLAFVFHKENRTVTEIVVFQTEDRGGDPDLPDSAEAALVRKAAAEGRIAYKLTTPDEFKAIAGKPTREWTESNGEVIWMKYPGIRVNFFGKPDVEIPHTLNGISCEGKGIDIRQNRPIVLRNEGDLYKLGSFSNIDLSRLNLSQQGDLLDRTSFDSLTVWPPSGRLPPGFDPAKRLEWGKNPGLGVRSLHREGITGKGVGIAIIDQPLLRDHIEYADRIKSYHAIEVEGVDIQMHGPPVCSIAVGKNCGVAPEASLHYYAVPPWKWGENRPWARTVEQIVERNRDLPPSEKVRVISISLGAFWQRDYLEAWQSAVRKAHQNGILVVTCDPLFLRYVTLERKVGTDPNDPNNYTFDSRPNALYVPASNWSIASHRGKDVYTFDTVGGNSWTVPYLAGLAAMAFQVHPEISPDRIVALFQETATRTKRGRVINPRGFVEAIKRIKTQGL